MGRVALHNLIAFVKLVLPLLAYKPLNSAHASSQTKPLLPLLRLRRGRNSRHISMTRHLRGNAHIGGGFVQGLRLNLPNVRIGHPSVRMRTGVPPLSSTRDPDGRRDARLMRMDVIESAG